ncbi:oxidation resistance protein 1 isoform X4 [Cloeon dipterum]|uniref:oxidation resistance protein 1 isoform X4 n=1 Tax=Cloeon dipterum TaxID=197152 RepID=UPI0032209AF5
MRSLPNFLVTPASTGPMMARRQSAWAAVPAPIVLAADEAPQTTAKRRKSWHHKLERRRRKGVVVAVGGTDPHAVAAVAAIADLSNSNQQHQLLQVPKQKRKSSWWNIFATDRPRRASQDVPPSIDNENLHCARSKSRSVDHGLLMPFDLNSLRSKVEGRIEAVQSEENSTDESAVEGTVKETKVASKITQPPNTVTYVVKASDTLTSVAACFDTTPGELAKLNKLPQRLPLFPGQVLFVPSRESAAANSDADGATSRASADDSLASSDFQSSTNNADSGLDIDIERQLLDSLRPVSPLPSARTSSSSDPQQGGHESSASFRKGKDVRERFLRINVRHITDGQGVVGGVLLVTPNAVMFDPNVSDPLVIEHGPESYGVIAPMEFVVNSAIYHDIAHMRVRHVPGADLPTPSRTADHPRPVIYYPAGATGSGGGAVSGADCSPVKDECFPELAHHTSSSNSPEASHCSSAEPGAAARDGDAFPKAFERDLVTPTAPADTPTPSPAPHAVSRLDDKPSIYDSGIDMRDNASASHATETIAEEESADSMPQDEGKILSCVTTRKKASSVSFSSDLDKEMPSSAPAVEVAEKTESKRAKGFKRLSYPIAWMENLSGSDKDSVNSLDSSSIPSQPSSADLKDSSQHSSVFSKVFSSSPLSVLDIGSNFFNKEPSSLPSHLQDPSARSSSPIFEFPPCADKVGGRSSVDVTRKVAKPDLAVHRASMADLGAKLNYHSMVSVEDMPELFVSFENPENELRKLASVKIMDYDANLIINGPTSYMELIPRPARPCDDPPMYLRLLMGKPINKRIPKSTPIMSYGKKKMRPEYWFSVPRNRIDDLYQFLQLWVPHLYGDVEDMDLSERGFELVESDTELWPDDAVDADNAKGNRSSTSSTGELGELTRESWEVLSMSEELRRALYAAGGSSAGSFDVDVFGLPELIGATEIFEDAHRARLLRHLPARAEGYPWTLVFSTSQHGFSLNSMFRKMAKVESPILLVVQDTENRVFGALTACALKVSDHFYGTGESFLFRFAPPSTPNNEEAAESTSQPSSPAKEEPPTPPPVGKIEVFDWTGENIFFVKGNNESLAIGAGDGKFGLWLDGDLYQGRTQPCSTYGNKALVEEEDFVVKALECWAFV